MSTSLDPVRVDPQTGLKIFRTRAAKASDKIQGKGYTPVEDEALTDLPEPPPGAARRRPAASAGMRGIR